MKWDEKRVLVTGAGGFIGSHLTERLASLGASTRAFVRYTSSGSRGWLDPSREREGIQVVAGDIRDLDTVKEAVKDVDIVFHLAALIGIPYSYHAPISYVRTNVEGTLNVLQAALAAKVEVVVHTSTSEVYGTARSVPIDEEHALQGQSPYSASKIGADMLAEAFHRSFDLPVATLRPFNTYGPRQSTRAIIPTIITQALTESEVHLGNLSPLRDLTFVEDTVNGFVSIAQTPAAIGQVVNVGSGKEISIGDLAEMILDLLEKDVTIVQDRERIRPSESEVQRLRADTGKAQKLWGWNPQHRLKEGLTRTIEWMRRNLDRYRPGDHAL